MSEIGEKRYNNEEKPQANKKSKVGKFANNPSLLFFKKNVLTSLVSIDARNEQKSTLYARKSQDKNFEMIANAKRTWEQLRRSDINRDEQKNLMAKMMSLIGGRVQDVSN